MIASYHHRDLDRPGVYDVTDKAFPYAVLGKLTVTDAEEGAVRVCVRSMGRNPVIETPTYCVERDRVQEAVAEALWGYLRAIERTNSNVDILPEEGA